MTFASVRAEPAPGKESISIEVILSSLIFLLDSVPVVGQKSWLGWCRHLSDDLFRFP